MWTAGHYNEAYNRAVAGCPVFGTAAVEYGALQTSNEGIKKDDGASGETIVVLLANTAINPINHCSIWGIHNFVQSWKLKMMPWYVCWFEYDTRTVCSISFV